MGAPTLFGDIFRLHQCTKKPLKYVHTNSNYGHLVSIPASDTQEFFSRAARYKYWVDQICIHLSGSKEENKVSMAQYLSKYYFEKYEDEATFSTSKCGLPVRTSMKP